MSDVSPTVLVVDDEEDVAEVHTLWLSDSYDVRVAYDGEQMLDEMDDDVDVVLLDRRMPNLSGDDALARLREEGYGCRVAMVTAVDPDFDILEMGFDDYLVKPVGREELRATVDRMLGLAEYNDAIQREFSLVQKQAALEAQKTEAELQESERYQTLRRERDRLKTEVTEAIGEMDRSTFRAVLNDLPGEGQA